GLLVEVVGSLGAGLAAQFEEAAQRLVQLALGFGALGSCGAAVAGGELARAALQLAHLAARLLGDPGEGAQALRQTGHAVGPQAAEGRALAEAEATRAVEVLHVTPEALHAVVEALQVGLEVFVVELEVLQVGHAEVERPLVAVRHAEADDAAAV